MISALRNAPFPDKALLVLPSALEDYPGSKEPAEENWTAVPADVTVPPGTPQAEAPSLDKNLFFALSVCSSRTPSPEPQQPIFPQPGTEADVLRQVSEQADRMKKGSKPGDLQHTELLRNSSKWKPGNEEANASGFVPGGQEAAEAARLAEEEKQLKQKQAEEAKEQERKKAEEAKQQELRRMEEAKELERKRAEEAKEQERKRVEEAKALERKKAEEAKELKRKQDEQKALEQKRQEEAKAQERKKAEEAKAQERKKAEEAKEQERKRAEEKALEQKRAEEAKAQERKLAEERARQKKLAEERALEQKRVEEAKAKELQKAEEARVLALKQAEDNAELKAQQQAAEASESQGLSPVPSGGNLPSSTPGSRIVLRDRRVGAESLQETDIKASSVREQLHRDSGSPLTVSQSTRFPGLALDNEEDVIFEEARRKRHKKKKPKKLKPIVRRIEMPPLDINRPGDIANAYGVVVKKKTLPPLKK